jgi:molybdopterin-guanine dinucleotide biosynthesis protein A
VSTPRGETSKERPAAVGAILAGGAGRRIGGAKATLELAGRPLISYPLAAMEEAELEPVVVAKRDSKLPPLGRPVIREPDRPQHPLCGVIAALEYAEGRPVVVVGCDMPFASPGLLAWLGSAPEPLVVPSVHDRLQPLLARYGHELAPTLEAALANAQAMQCTVESLRPRVVAEEELTRFGDPWRLCFNVNTPADLEQARRLIEPAGS